MKKIILLLSLLIFLIPFSSASAYTGGLLHGKPINMGSAFGITSKTGLNATDGDLNTYERLAGPGLNPDVFWYEFPTEKTIDSYAILSGQVALRFYDQNKKTIKTIEKRELIYGGVRAKITPLPGVKYVSIENAYSSTNVVEWDVFEAPPIVYDEIKNLKVTNSKEKEITITWDNPSSNVDFTGVKIYRDNQLIRQGDKTLENFLNGSLSHSTNYVFKVSAVYSDGYETPGLTLNVTTATPPPPPPPVPAISGATIEKNGDYLLKWAAPTSGDIQIIIGGQNYLVVPANSLGYTIPAADMKYRKFVNDPDVAIYPIDTLGRQTVTVRPQFIGVGNPGQVKTPFTANELLKVMLGLFGLVAAFVFIALAFRVVPKLTGTIETAASEKTKQRIEQKEGREKRPQREEREGKMQHIEKPQRAARARERAIRSQRAAKVRGRAEKSQRATRTAKITAREKGRAENGL